MKAIALLNHMVRMTRKSRREISESMGRSASYIGSIAHRKTIPAIDVFSEIAKACDYEVHVIGHDEDIVVDPRDS